MNVTRVKALQPNDPTAALVASAEHKKPSTTMRVLLALALPGALALVPPPAPATTRTILQSWQPNTNFNGEQENRLTDFERAARDAGAGERKVTIRKPLGLVLDARPGGDVYVKEVTPGGNAEAIGQVKVGDTIQMCSATFGNQMWSTRGAGLDRVMRAIEVRAGPTCSLVLQSKAEQKNFLADMFGQQKKVQQQRIEDAATKRETLEAEVKAERDEAAKGWFGIF